MRTFEHPMNGHRETVENLSILWALLFGWFYFAIRGLWVHIVIQLGIAIVLGVATGGPGTLLFVPIWIVYAFFTPSILVGRYQKNGWREVSASDQGSNGVRWTDSAPPAPVDLGSWGRTPSQPSPPAPAPSATEPASSTHSVADELNKLLALKDRGVLTEEEFARQKAVVLGGKGS